MWALLSPSLWRSVAVAAALAAVAGAYYTWRSVQREVGRVEVRAQWNADIDQRMAAALVASEAARAKEQALQTKVRKVSDDYSIEKTRRAAADLLAADSLRQLQAALAGGGGASSDTAAPERADDDPRDSIVAECAAALVGLDAAARRLAGQAIALQEYAAGVCVSPRNISDDR